MDSLTLMNCHDGETEEETLQELMVICIEYWAKRFKKRMARKENMEGLKTIDDMFRSNYKEQARLKETAVKGEHHTSNSTKKVTHLFL